MIESNVTKSLIEPSVADLLMANEAATDLTNQQRRHRACSLRVVAKGLGKPPELLPARWTALRQPISRLHHVQMGMTTKTLANHKANQLRHRLKDNLQGPPRCGMYRAIP